jgi:hypothetical protein
LIGASEEQLSGSLKADSLGSWMILLGASMIAEWVLGSAVTKPFVQANGSLQSCNRLPERALKMRFVRVHNRHIV